MPIRELIVVNFAEVCRPWAWGQSLLAPPRKDANPRRAPEALHLRGAWAMARVAILGLAVVACTGSGELTGGSSPDAAAGTTPGDCTYDPDHPSSCTYWTCENVPTPLGNKTHCTSPNPPGMPHPGGDYTCPASGGGSYCPGDQGGGSGPWTCHADEFTLTCDRGSSGQPDAAAPRPDAAQPPPDAATPDAATPPPGSDCPMLGQQRWCDGPTYCGWGLQTCVASAGAWRWGACAEVSGRAPDTSCSCNYPYAFNRQCCERPDCLYVGERSVPCGGSNGQLCAPCGSSVDCANGYFCVNDGLAQFCSNPCLQASDCPSGYLCLLASGSPISLCVPASGTCP